MTAEENVSPAVVAVSNCEHRHKKSLFKSKEVRKKLKLNRRVCQECERIERNGTAQEAQEPANNDRLFICVSCGYLTCSRHAQKHWEAVRTGDKHPILMDLDSSEMRCQACEVVLTSLDDPQDMVKLFCNDYRSFVKSRPATKPSRKVDLVEDCRPIEPSKETVEVDNQKLVKNAPDEREVECMVPAKGLQNLGNTCFFNSVMQCLMHTHHLKYYFSRFGNVKSLRFRETQTVVVNDEKVELEPATISVPAEGTPLNSVLQGFVAEFYCGASPSPGPLFSQISCKTPRFKGHQQQDAHELLRYLLDGLRSEEMELYKSAIAAYFNIPARVNFKNVDQEKATQAKGYLQAAGRPLLDMVFGGTLLQTILCSECGHVSERHEQFLDLSIPVTSAGTGGRLQAGRSAGSKRQENGNKTRRKGNRRNAPQDNDDLSECDTVVKPEDYACYQENGHCSEGEMDRLAAGIDRLDFTKVLVRPPQEYTNGECSIGSCMLEFTAPEKLQRANAYECEKCCVPHNKKTQAVGNQKRRVCAFKRYLVYEPPVVLTLHLKRFQQSESMSGRRTTARKISGHVSFPLLFDMAPFCCRNVQRISRGEKRILYSLYGVVVHSGGLSGGHYIAYVKSRPRLKQAHAFLESARSTCADSLTSPIVPGINHLREEPQLWNEGQWYYCSDSQVQPVLESRVLSAEAYILFYERVL